METIDDVIVDDKYFIKNFKNEKIIHLDRKMSCVYIKDKNIRIKLNKIMKNLNKKLDINLDNCYTLIDTSILSYVHSLTLFNCVNIIDVSSLGSLYKLNLSDCYSIKNVKSLGLIHELNLSSCFGVKDVSMLKSVHTLNLSNCTNVKDISMLTSVHTLDVTNCRNIKDIGNLRKLKVLAMTWKIKGIHLMKELTKLVTYNKNKIMDLHIQKLKKINPGVNVIYI
jgi:hypothetical protein